jgi:long-subunit fatty acid transport protein
LNDQYQNGFGFSAMGEFTLTKRWTARVGIEILPALAKGSTTTPSVGASESAGLSVGASLKALSGEFSFGYQVRQTRSHDSTGIDGVWDASGYRATGSTLRTKATGHLFSIGYKRAF